MANRTRKIQTRYKVTGSVGNKTTKVLPVLELSGKWFKAAGFLPGQLVSIQTQEGVITIRQNTSL